MRDEGWGGDGDFGLVQGGRPPKVIVPAIGAILRPRHDVRRRPVGVGCNRESRGTILVDALDLGVRRDPTPRGHLFPVFIC